jgi:signal transduction histidine kinase
MAEERRGPSVGTVERIELFVRRHWWVSLVLVVTVTGTWFREQDDPTGRSGASAVTVAVVAVLGLLLRVRRPELAVGVTAGAVTAYLLAGFADGPIYLSLVLVLYALASRKPLREWARWWLGAMLAVVVGWLVRELGSGETLWSVLVRLSWLLAVTAAAAATGSAVRSRQSARAAQAQRTATEEQLRMAQDLHDGVGHGLAVIAMQAGVALHVLDRDPDKARASLEAIRDTSRESLEALRAQLTRLAPTGEVAPRAPRSGLADLPVLVDRMRAGGLEVRVEGRAGAVPDEVDAAAYVVVQESLTNVLKHAGARTAMVRLTRTPTTLEVTVADDGRGSAGGTTGLGISGMRGRVEALGGTLEAGPGPRGGFLVRATLPTSEVPA